MSGLAENEPAKPKDPLLSIALSHGFSSNFCQLEVLPPASPLRRQVADHIDLAAPGVLPAQSVDQVGDRKTLRIVEAPGAADDRAMTEADAQPHEEVPALLAGEAGPDRKSVVYGESVSELVHREGVSNIKKIK